MGNCSTQKQNIIVPQQPGIIQTEFIKPEPSVFHIPMELHQPIQPQSNSSPLSKNTYLPSNPNLQPIELNELNSLKPNTLFADHVFKGQKKSIGQKLIIDHLEWKRPSQFLRQDPIIFQGEIQQYDLKQGRLQNSYFVSAFSLLGNTQEVFTEVLSNIFGSRIQQINVSQNGAYVLWLFVEGWWKKIVIDDLMPTSYGNYMFSNYRNQLWIWLIEKAYAKTFKSYENIQKGLLGPFLTTLTGAPYQYLNTKSIELISPDIAWQFVKQNMDSGYLLSVSTETCDRNKYFQRDSTFSYNVLDCQQVYILTTTKKKRQRILKLNNPWGRYEWKGRWSQYSDVWSEELRHQLDYEKADDSVMWINIEDLLKNFGQICSCKYKSDFINTSLNLKFKQQSSNQLKGIFIHISQRTQGYLSLIQPDHRHFPKSYSYSMSKLILLQMQKETKKPKLVLNQKIDFDHTCTFPVQLNPGLYYLIIQMDWTCSFTRDATVNLYTDRVVYLKEDDKMPTGEQLFYQLVQIQQAHGKVLEVYEYPHDPNIKRITGVFGGYVYYHYFNESKDNKYLSETVKLGDSKNLVVVGESSPKQFAIKLLPGQEKLVKMKITKQGTGQYTFNPIVKNQVFQKFTMQSLLQMLKKKPTKSRQRDIESELIEVYIKTFQYSGGVALLYSNQMSKYSYIQQIVFDISNLKLENEVLQEGYKYNIELEPHQQKVLSFVIIDPSKSFTFKTKVEYYLGTPEFKF